MGLKNSVEFIHIIWYDLGKKQSPNMKMKPTRLSGRTQTHLQHRCTAILGKAGCSSPTEQTQKLRADSLFQATFLERFLRCTSWFLWTQKLLSTSLSITSTIQQFITRNAGLYFYFLINLQLFAQNKIIEKERCIICFISSFTFRFILLIQLIHTPLRIGATYKSFRRIINLTGTPDFPPASLAAIIHEM